MYEEQTQQFALKVGGIHVFTVQVDEEIIDLRPEWVKKNVPPEAWRGCFQHFDGTIYLSGQHKSTDGGKTLGRHGIAGLEAISILHNQRHSTAPGPEGAVLSRPGLFLALGGDAHFSAPGVYTVKAWRSTDNLATIQEGQAILRVPLGPLREREKGEWFGLYVCRQILEMPDGMLLATAEGTFEEDRIEPATGPGKHETHYLIRTFIITSKDDGRTWDYLSTVAAPRPDDPVDEGFGEPTLALLDNGQLLCLLRTGHHRPLYACWSADGGSTWSEPAYTGLERGCWPCLVKLADGRLVVSFGMRFPVGWSRITPEGDHGRWTWPGSGLVQLAINDDGTGRSWVQATIGEGLGSCYTTLFEVEPNMLFCQVDGWYWRIMLMPKVPNKL
ncbi:MAG: sialidase family protein [Verrucomicrobia bacterium]|nr:sialidase family protein [Verrucomicrobiota bacterium]